MQNKFRRDGLCIAIVQALRDDLHGSFKIFVSKFISSNWLLSELFGSRSSVGYSFARYVYIRRQHRAGLRQAR
jgi:hypothetical protein